MTQSTALLLFAAGLIGFLALHSVRIVAPNWRESRIRDWGLQRYKGVYSLLAIVTFALLICGYAQARSAPVLVWVPPRGLRHLAALLTIPALVLLVAANVPGNHFKAKLKHPMLLAIKLWATAHLLIGMWLHSILLFAGFLAWAIVDFRSARRRAEQPAERAPSWGATVITVVVGLALWALFAFYAHAWLIGVSPFG